ncbi:MAG: extracellular solute-binding protein [Candidatus Taylorbacteria bacterium]|nr:extracellular solute-binding protein [Candidatus Taylorbacteria bacterium]
MKTTKFQITVLIIFVIFIIGGVVMFATYKGSQGENRLPPITIWGTFPKDKFDLYVSKVNNSLTLPLTVTYVEQNSSEFLNNFVAALARGNGPDAVLIPADMLLPAQDKLTLIPYSAFSQRAFLNQFIDEAGVYLGTDGLMGVPFSVDPMVMYWNRDMFNAAGIATTPKYWDEFTAINKKLTIKDDNGTVTRSAIAMGDFYNVTNARELLGSLILQSGNPITAPDNYGALVSTLKPTGDKSPVPAVTFFTQFVDPGNENYSWNHSWPDSKTAFVSGKLATYFGLASELYNIRQKNPNLNFDVATMPQLRTGGITATYGKIYGFSIVKQSQVANAAFQVISTLTLPQFLGEISSSMYLPSVSRDIIAAGTKDPYIAMFNVGALISRTWRDADPAESSKVLGTMVQAITTGQKSIFQALTDAAGRYDLILQRAVGQ